MSTLKRIGFHYFLDANHYKKSDLETWLPKLVAMDTSWLVLTATEERAIPERFLRGLIESQIKPVLQFQFHSDKVPDLEEVKLLLEIYAKWGVQYITFFNKPNLRSFWKTANWTKEDLVERFLDIYLPLAEICLEFDLTPIFPPLEPGGDYWDTIFLKAALMGIKRRGHTRLLNNLVIGTIARNNGRSLNWGVGGPERWPESIPYSQEQQGEDHQGFRIYDWYQAIIQSCLVKQLPIFLFEVIPSGDNEYQGEIHSTNSLAVAQLMAGEPLPDLEPVSPLVIGSAFWLLASDNSGDHSKMTWFKSDGKHLPSVGDIQDWIVQRKRVKRPAEYKKKHIRHYILLPGFDKDGCAIDIDFIRPLINKYKPTIGFSIDEAKLADRVTIINFNGGLPDDTANQLRYSGCIVRQVDDVAQLLHL